MIESSVRSRAQESTSIEGKDAVGLYLSAIGRTPLLSAPEEVELAKAIEAGLYAEHLLTQKTQPEDTAAAPGLDELRQLAAEGRRAKQQFITANLRLVVSIARRYAASTVPMLDMIQDGNTGLIRAVEKFDFTKGYKFSTYGTWWIRQSITRGIAQQSRVVRLPAGIAEKVSQVHATARGLERRLGREPSWAEVAEEMGVTVERVLDLVRYGREQVSLDAPVDDHEDTLLGSLIAREQAPGPDQLYLDSMQRDELNSIVNSLDRRSADIVRRRYGLLDGRPTKVRDIAAFWNISPARVRQLERRAISLLRERTVLAA